MHKEQLTKQDIEKVRLQAKERLMAYYKLYDIIGSQVFHILEKESRVLYYPFEDQSVWGFSETMKEKSFVCINTSIPYERQVFAAAHELYHLWYGSSGEIMLSEDMEEGNSVHRFELLANRFAAEFLIDEELLLQQMRVYGLDKEKIDIRTIVKLANIFVVPYRTMVKRFYEIHLIKESEYIEFMSYSDEKVNIWQRRLGISKAEGSKKIGFGDLIDKAMHLYERQLITYEKLEYILSLENLSPMDMGIQRQEACQVPSDEELDAIMEGEV